MGNQYSSFESDGEVIKFLYKCAEEDLDIIRHQVNNNVLDIDVYQLLPMLIDKQNGLLGKIPTDNFNKVSKFLDLVTQDFNERDNNEQNQSQYNEDDLEAQFKREQQERERAFYESQKKRRQTYENDLNNFNNSNIDGRDLFKLSPNYTMDELKIAYRNLARRFHPDRPDGNHEKFQIITKAYMSLMEELKMKEKDKQFNELKQESDLFRQQQENDPRQNIKFKTGRFDPKLFNKIYDENRLHDVRDQGYTEWINSTKLEEREIEKPEVFSDNFNINVFNNIFEQQVKNTHEMVEFKEPQAQNFNDFSNTSGLLGIDSIDNFGGSGYADFREAHTMHRLVDHRFEASGKPKIKSLDQLKAERSNITKLTEEELREVELSKKKKEKEDADRMYRMKTQDEEYSNQFNKMNHRFLETNMLQRR